MTSLKDQVIIELRGQLVDAQEYIGKLETLLQDIADATQDAEIRKLIEEAINAHHFR